MEIKQLKNLGVEQADRETKRGKRLPSRGEWKKWLVHTALSNASQKMDFLARREKSVCRGLVKLNIRENF